MDKSVEWWRLMIKLQVELTDEFEVRIKEVSLGMEWKGAQIDGHGISACGA